MKQETVKSTNICCAKNKQRQLSKANNDHRMNFSSFLKIFHNKLNIISDIIIFESKGLNLSTNSSR